MGYHVIVSGKKWRVKKTGALRASKRFDTVVDATNFGMLLAKRHKTCLYVHQSDGRVTSKDDFSFTGPKEGKT